MALAEAVGARNVKMNLLEAGNVDAETNAKMQANTWWEERERAKNANHDAKGKGAGNGPSPTPQSRDEF